MSAIDAPLCRLCGKVHWQRVDWRGIFQDLRDSGFPAYRVAGCIGREWSTVQRWVEGVEPRHSDGEAILALHARWCGKDRTEFRLASARARNT